jgi:hypothetical protein
MPAILFLLSTILKTIPLSLFNASSAVVMNAMWSRKSRTVFVYILPHALPCFLACCFIHHANETTDFLTSQKRQALPSSSRFLLLIIAYQWSNMGNRGFLHTTPAPMMPTILLSSIKISLPADRLLYHRFGPANSISTRFCFLSSS